MTVISKKPKVTPYSATQELLCLFGEVCERVGEYVCLTGDDPPDSGDVPSAFAEAAAFEPTNVEHLMKAHRAIMGDEITDAGEFRKRDARILRGAQVAYVPPAASKVPALALELLEWAGDSGEHPLVASCLFHYQLLCLHPFTDGNGRLARLWQTLLLAKWHPALGVLWIEAAVKEREADYLRALSASDRQKDASPFVAFMLDVLAAELKDRLARMPSSITLPAPTPAPARTAPRLSDFVERLLMVLDGRTLTGAELMKGLGMSHRGTFRKNYLDPALALGYVEMTQPDSPKSPTQKYRLTELGKTLI